MNQDADVVIVGAGLSGLACAHLLSEAGKSVRLLEARDVPGGRIRSIFDAATGRYLADLGPTWVWPAFQPVIGRWIDKLAVETFPQFDTGNAMIDYGPDIAPVAHPLPGQEGIARITGGPQALIDRLAEGLPEGVLATGSPVKAITTAQDGVQVSTTDGRILSGAHAIIALPPRVAAGTIIWTPALPEPLDQVLQMMPTWMAPHAKVVAIYDRPFWRERGLSGRIASQAGPIDEAHDHCGPDGTPAALFGFIGWPPELRARAGADLKPQIHAQLMRCFGPDCPEPVSIHLEDWAIDPLVASPADITGPMSHPDIGPAILRQPHGRLCFAGAEVASQSPGLIEGAFAAAEATVAQLV
jgi:monoamine oxidase